MVTTRDQTIYIAEDGSKHLTRWEAEKHEVKGWIQEIFDKMKPYDADLPVWLIKKQLEEFLHKAVNEDKFRELVLKALNVCEKP